MFLNSLIFQSLCLYNVYHLVKSNIVDTTTGPVKGKQNFFGATTYFSYQGIPYAKPPIGKLRFMPPVPIDPWIKVRDATAPGYVCPQTELYYQRCDMNEDCLFLNVFVPVTKSAKLLPTIFYIHGGAFLLGSGRPRPMNSPRLMLAKGMIVVSINYRIGALGFLSMDSKDASGNAGLKDIYLALKWVNSNIATFGGDPNTICLVGQGSGAVLVHYLLLTNQTTGLFQSAAMFGGNALSYKSLQLYPKKNALKLAETLNLNYTNKKDLLHKLKETDAFDVVAAADYIANDDPREAFIVRDLFSPVIEKSSDNAIITSHPYDIIRTVGLIQKVPLLNGCNNQEGLGGFLLKKEEKIHKLNENFEMCIPTNIQYPYGSEQRRNLANAIRQFYFNGGNITIFNTQNYINLLTDTTDCVSANFWINTYKKQRTSSAVYYYNFSYDGKLNWAKLLFGITHPGACHADELGYLLLTNVTESRLQNLDSKDRMIMDGLLYSLKNLAMYGNPSATKFGFQWVEAGVNGPHLAIGDKVTNVYGPPTPDRLAFWTTLYQKYGRDIELLKLSPSPRVDW